jgi:hypothetical protein
MCIANAQKRHKPVKEAMKMKKKQAAELHRKIR